MLKIYFILSTSFLLISCATSTNNQAINQDMSCNEINTETQKLNTKITTRQNTKETNRVIDTGSTVAVQGASIAGVPYVGSVFSIGKTLLNHNKQTAKIKAQQAEERLYRLQDLAYEKNCPPL